jgi:hypothetical protein
MITLVSAPLLLVEKISNNFQLISFINPYNEAWYIYICCIFPVNVINFFIMFARSNYFYVSLHSK